MSNGNDPDAGALVDWEHQEGYNLRISRLTIDKLGVKLYDKASAVVAELVANGYDADAEYVKVEVPLGTELGRRLDDGSVEDRGYAIVVSDDGHGMTPGEARRDYLDIGRDRRRHAEQGAISRTRDRPVMGRKGIGKLAPFGICRRIEVLSSGGERTPDGYLTTHFIMDFDAIVSDSSQPVPLEIGAHDGSYREDSGTIIRLTDFLAKRVPAQDTFMRQLARRFAVAEDENFRIDVQDTRPEETVHPVPVGAFDVPTMPGTVIDVSDRPVISEEGRELPVSGWLGLASEAYRNEEMAGVRIYARGKIVATTRDFEQPAGFTGEFTTRSYLVGAVHAEWLDQDEGEDLVRTDRQSIIWDSDLGRALRDWGADLIKEIGAASRGPRRARVRDIFIEKSSIEARARDRFGDESVVQSALELGRQIGAFAAEDELEDQDYIDSLSDVVLTMAPHRALIGAFQDFQRVALGTDLELTTLLELFGKTRVAEMASYSQIAEERVRVINELSKIVFDDESDEAALQSIIARAPWLIKADWTVITQNQSLSTFKTAFEAFLRQTYNEEVTLAIDMQLKRPDFVVANVGGELHVVEIKASRHTFNDDDFDRLHNYVVAFREFAINNPELIAQFPGGWVIDLITDGVNLRKPVNQDAFDRAIERGELVGPISWVDFLDRAKRAHEQFLEAHNAAIREAREREGQ